ncbi:MAG: Ig-like domain-containing protein [Myxococcota bacterium]
MSEADPMAMEVTPSSDLNHRTVAAPSGPPLDSRRVLGAHARGSDRRRRHLPASAAFVAALLLAAGCAPSQDPTIELTCTTVGGESLFSGGQQSRLDVGSSFRCRIVLTNLDDTTSLEAEPPLYEWAIASTDGGAVQPGPAVPIRDWVPGFGPIATEQVFTAQANGTVTIRMRQLATAPLLFRETRAGSSLVTLRIGPGNVPTGCLTDAECAGTCATRCAGKILAGSSCDIPTGECSCSCVDHETFSDPDPDAADPGGEELAELPDSSPEILPDTPDPDGIGPDADTVQPGCDVSGYVAVSQDFFTVPTAGFSRYEAFSGATPAARLRLEFKAGILSAPGEYHIAGNALDQSASTCTICAWLEVACGETACDVSYFGTGGTITVTELDLAAGTFVGTLTEATFQTVATATQEVISGGDVWCVDELELAADSSCAPVCSAACGVPDGCGGTCGCPAGQSCDELTHLCQACSPACDGTCGISDGCGGTCTCSGTDQCNQGTHLCEPCAPSCGAACSIPDGCGGTCQCDALDVCNAATKLCEACAPDCAAGTCGIDDLCGGTCGCGAGETCDTDSATCIAPPPAPTGLAATAGAGGVTLTWTASPGATSYTLYLGFAPGVTAQNGAAIPAATSPAFVGSLAPGLPARFVVTAQNAAGASGPSNEATATPLAEPDTTAPLLVFTDPPGGAIGVATTAAVRVGFSEPLAPATLAAGLTLGGQSGDIAGTVTQSGQVLTFTPTAPLSPATSYTLSVTTALQDLAGNALASGFSSQFTTRPAAPSGLELIEGHGAITLRWAAVAGAKGYAISRAESAAGPFTTIGGSTRPSFTDRAANNGTPYTYRVTAFTDAGESGASVLATGTASDLANPTPANPTTIPGNGEAVLLWDSVGPDATYSIYRAASDGGAFNLLATGLFSVTFRDAGLTNGTRYRYVVQARSTSPDSAWSEEAQVIPTQALLPAPTGLAATVGSGWVELTWGSVPGALGYAIYAVGDSPSDASDGLLTRARLIQGSAATSALVEVADGTNWYLSVAAISTLNQLGAPSQAFPTQPDTKLPPRPSTLLRAFPTEHGTIHVDWQRAPGATSYRLMRLAGAGGPPVEVIETAGLSHDDSGLAPGLHGYTIEPLSNGGAASGGTSDTLYTVATAGPAEAPQNLTAIAGKGCVTVAWQHALGASGYEVRRKFPVLGEVPIAYLAAATENMMTDCDVADGVAYEYDVRAYTNSVYSGPSNVAQATPNAGLPDAPAITATAGRDEVVLRWTPIPGATYRLMVRSDTAPWGDLAMTDEAYFLHPAVGPAAPYQYAVQANVSGALSAFAFSGTVTPAGDTLPPVPGGLTAHAGHGCVTLAFDLVATAEGYEVIEVEGGVLPTSGSYFSDVGATRYTRCGLVDGDAYTFRVRAWDQDTGYSDFSAPVTISPVAALPDSPPVAAVTVGHGMAELSWESAGPGVLYHVYRRTRDRAWDEIGVTSALQFADPQAASGTTYIYAIRSETPAVGLGALSNADLAGATNALVHDAYPIPPADLTAEPGKGCVTIGWSPVPGATGYEIYRADALSGPFATLSYFDGGFAHRYTDCGLTDGITQFYKVRSWSSAQASYSGASAVIEATPGANLPTSPAPTLLAGNAQVDLTWAAAEPPGTALYVIFRRTQATPWLQVGATTDSYWADRSVANGTGYIYALQAGALGQYGALSDGALAGLPTAIPDAALPPAPANVTANAGSGCVTVRWDVVAGATYYAIARGLASGGPLNQAFEIAGGFNNAHTFCDVQDGTPYRFFVQAYTEAGYSARSTAALATPLATLPASPEGGAALQGAGAGAIQLSWAAIPGVLGYRILRRTDAAAWSVVAQRPQSANPTWQDTGLASGTIYYYALQSFSAAGVSAQSPEASLAAP